MYWYHNEEECIKPKSLEKEYIKLTQKYTTYAVSQKAVSKFDQMFSHHLLSEKSVPNLDIFKQKSKISLKDDLI